MDDKILVVQNVSKKFPGVQALSNVDFHLKRGEVRALVGKNGAGKSTLIKIITGIYGHDSGSLFLDAQEVRHVTTRTMHGLGVRAIYQTNELVPYFTVGESVMLNEEQTKFGGWILDRKSSNRVAKEILENQLGVQLSVSALIRDLDVSQKQLVQIAKNIVSLPKILIFDEPTASLSANEITQLFKIIKSLKIRGVSVIYISHRFDEIFDIADSVTILRDGKKIADLSTKENSQDDVIRLMVGENVAGPSGGRDIPSGEDSVLSVNGMTSRYFRGLSFELAKGEILGIFGSEGSGHDKVAQALFGLLDWDGEMKINGGSVSVGSPGEAIRKGIGYVPRDRKQEGLVIDFDVRENMTLPMLSKFSRAGFIGTAEEDSAAERQIAALSIITPSPRTSVANLSGGNQQKVVIGRWIVAAPQILLLDYPTSGIDVKAKTEVHSILMRLTEGGVSIIVISPEYEETAALCDRVLVMMRGEVVKEFSRKEFDEHEMLRFAIGSVRGDTYRG